MSGIEVAGIVLAVLPLFISAWEDYRRGLEPAKAFWNWERQLPEHIRSLMVAATLYEMNIKALIAPVVSDEELEAMTDKSYSVLWKDPAIQSKIVNRLGKASSAFESNMQRFEKICRGELSSSFCRRKYWPCRPEHVLTEEVADIAKCLDLGQEMSNSSVRSLVAFFETLSSVNTGQGNTG